MCTARIVAFVGDGDDASKPDLTPPAAIAPSKPHTNFYSRLGTQDVGNDCMMTGLQHHSNGIEKKENTFVSHKYAGKKSALRYDYELLAGH